MKQINKSSRYFNNNIFTMKITFATYKLRFPSKEIIQSKTLGVSETVPT